MVMKLLIEILLLWFDKLDSFIESVISVETNEKENVIGLCKIVVDEYLPIVV